MPRVSVQTDRETSRDPVHLIGDGLLDNPGGDRVSRGGRPWPAESGSSRGAGDMTGA